MKELQACTYLVSLNSDIELNVIELCPLLFHHHLYLTILLILI